MAKATQAIPAGTFTVKDPETGNDVELEIFKDPVSGAMLAVESLFLEQVSLSFNSPYNRKRLAAPEADSVNDATEWKTGWNNGNPPSEQGWYELRWPAQSPIAGNDVVFHRYWGIFPGDKEPRWLCGGPPEKFGGSSSQSCFVEYRGPVPFDPNWDM